MSHWLFKVKLKLSGQDHSDVRLNPALGCCAMTFHYDENIILSWMKKSMLNVKQNFSMSILDSFRAMDEIVVLDMLSHYVALSKRRKDLIYLTQNCKEIFLIHQIKLNFKCFNTCNNNVTKQIAVMFSNSLASLWT